MGCNKADLQNYRLLLTNTFNGQQMYANTSTTEDVDNCNNLFTMSIIIGAVQRSAQQKKESQFSWIFQPYSEPN